MKRVPVVRFAQPVDADAIFLLVDCPFQIVLQHFHLLGRTQTLEDRHLDTLAVGFADLRDTPQASPPGGCLRRHVVHNQKLHARCLASHVGPVVGEITAEVTCEQPSLHMRYQSKADLLAEKAMRDQALLALLVR